MKTYFDLHLFTHYIPLDRHNVTLKVLWIYLLSPLYVEKDDFLSLFTCCHWLTFLIYFFLFMLIYFNKVITLKLSIWMHLDEFYMPHLFSDRNKIKVIDTCNRLAHFFQKLSKLFISNFVNLLIFKMWCIRAKLKLWPLFWLRFFCPDKSIKIGMYLQKGKINPIVIVQNSSLFFFINLD
jgi:hypothetical protein